jgi:hydroxyacylglutathione hydrolase
VIFLEENVLERESKPVRLVGDLYVVAGNVVSHSWDANAYLIAGEEPVLIDCGGSLGYGALRHNLGQLGYEPKDIGRVIATHGHWDHLAGMEQLRKESDASLFIHRADREPVETGDPDRTAAFLYGLTFPPLVVNGELEDGQKLRVGEYRLRVIHTPGHTPGSVSLLVEIEGKKVLVAGDTLWGGFHPKILSDLDAWEASLEKLAALEFDAVTIGHSAPMLIEDGKKNLEEARRQLGVYFNPWFRMFNGAREVR